MIPKSCVKIPPKWERWVHELDACDERAILSLFEKDSALGRLVDIESIIHRNLICPDAHIDHRFDFVSFLGRGAKKIHDVYMKNFANISESFFHKILKRLYDEEAAVKDTYIRIRNLMPIPLDGCPDLISLIVGHLEIADTACFLRVNRQMQKSMCLLYNKLGYQGNDVGEGMVQSKQLFRSLVRISEKAHKLPQDLRMKIYGPKLRLQMLTKISAMEFLSLFNSVAAFYLPCGALLNFYKKYHSMHIKLQKECFVVPLNNAVAEKSMLFIDFALDLGCDARICVENKNRFNDEVYRRGPLLNYVVRIGDLNLVKKLITLGANVNERDSDGHSPLEIEVRAEFSDAGIIELLLANGARVNAVNPSDFSALQYICKSNFKRQHLVPLLLRYGADPNFRDEKGKTSLHHVCEALEAPSEQNALLKLLLEYGADPNLQCCENNVPLHFAAYRGLAKSVATLIAFGAKVHVLDASKITPLHYAARAGHFRVMRQLATPDTINLMDNLGCTPLHNVCLLKSNNLEMVKWMLEQGADPNSDFSIHAAAKRQRAEIVGMLLLKAPGRINARGAHGRTPLMWACDAKTFNENLAQLLLQNGADVHLETSGLKQALHFAALRGHAPAARMLLEAGAEVNNKRGDDGKTALNLACLGSGYRGFLRDESKQYRSSPDLIHILLKHGADPAIADDQGKSPALHAPPPFDAIIKTWDFFKSNFEFKIKQNGAG